MDRNDGIPLASNVEVHDMLNGKVVGNILTAHGENVVDLLFSPDGRMLLTVEKTELHRTTFQIWDARTFKEIGQKYETNFEAPFGQTLTIRHTASFSPDSKRIAIPARDRFAVYEIGSQNGGGSRNARPAGEPRSDH